MTDWLKRLRDHIGEYTPQSVYDLIGPEAHAALGRNETTAAERRTRDGSPLSTLIRLFALHQTEPLDRARDAFGDSLSDVIEQGLIEVKGDQARALIELRAYGDDDRDAWVFCDLTPGLDGRNSPTSPDHVLGISEASSTLAQLTVRKPGERALDLGTGCGVQSLHLASHIGQIVATDVNDRALRFAQWTAALNGFDIDTRNGSLYEPVADERFDLIVTNPPFVISPPTATRLTYRDSGMPGDDAVAEVVRGAARHLNDGGICHVLANWIHREGEPWQQRLSHWTEGLGLDVWAVQREVADPATYAELWLSDAGLRSSADYREQYNSWLSWFEHERIEGVGFGWITLRATDHEWPHRRFESAEGPVAQPLGATIADWLDATSDLLGLSDDDLLARHLRRADDVAEHTVGVPGSADPSRITVRQERGMRREHDVDTFLAGFIGASDGELPAGAIIDALAGLLDVDPLQARRDMVSRLRTLIDEGFLERAGVAAEG